MKRWAIRCKVDLGPYKMAQCFAHPKCEPLNILKALQIVPVLPNGVPQIIHQTWKTKELPEHWAPGSKAWASLHADWIYLMWTDSDIEAYIETMWPQYRALFAKLEHAIQRVDLFRYFVLRDFGGLYCDLDIVAKRNVGPILGATPGHVFLVPSANTSGQYTNALMVSTTSPTAKAFWTSMIEYVEAFPSTHADRVLSSVRHTRIVASTGPMALSRVADRSSGPITVLPKRLWNPYELTVAGQLDRQTNDEALVYILQGSSWHAADSTFFVFVYTHRVPMVVLGALAIVWILLQNAYLHDKASMLLRKLRRTRPAA